MLEKSAWMEIFRWGYANVPGILFQYAKEFDLEMEDIGILAAFFYTFQRTQPLYQTGLKMGQVLQACPSLSKQKLGRKIKKYNNLEIIEVDYNSKAFVETRIFLEPLLKKLESFLIANHPDFDNSSIKEFHKADDVLINDYREKIEQLELALENEKKLRISSEINPRSTNDFRKMADFISKKTGNLLSVKMAAELKKWLEEMALTPDFLLCVLELCFERSIHNPADISRIVRDLKEYSIANVEGLESYFQHYVDKDSTVLFRTRQWDPDIMEFGSFTGIDMKAEARKRVYYKWRYDWRFSHPMIMKAGEIMCQRTKNGGLEYIDSVLSNWMSKEIRQIEEAEKEISNFRAKKKNEKSGRTLPKKEGSFSDEYEIFVPPALEEIKK
jgi:hypothetical protein